MRKDRKGPFLSSGLNRSCQTSKLSHSSLLIHPPYQSHLGNRPEGAKEKFELVTWMFNNFLIEIGQRISTVQLLPKIYKILKKFKDATVQHGWCIYKDAKVAFSLGYFYSKPYRIELWK